MRKMRAWFWIVTVLVASAGCATGRRAADFSDVRRLTAEREGKDVRWDRGGPEDLAARDAVRSLLAKELGVEEAVQVALLNNPTLQATFEEIGIAQADFVQSGLLRNPLFHIGTQYGTGGATGVRLDYSAVLNFLDVLRIPMRRRVAAVDLERATLRAADAVLVLARDARIAYWTVVARAEELSARRKALEAFEAAAELARRQHAAGNLSDIDRLQEEDAALLAQLEITRAETRLQGERETLTRLLGLCGGDVDWRIPDHLPVLPASEPALDDVGRAALCRRLDLAAAREEVRAIAVGLPLTRIDPWAASEFGVSGERDADGKNHVGPDLTLEVPLFDTGRAAAARETAKYRQAERRYRALEVGILSEVREARSRLLAARRAAEFYRDTWLPRRRQATSLWQEQYNAMLEGTYRLLQAKREEIDAGRDAGDALRDYWIARADLERAVGGRLPRGDPAAPPPAPQAPEPPPSSAPESPRPTHKHGG